MKKYPVCGRAMVVIAAVAAVAIMTSGCEGLFLDLDSLHFYENGQNGTGENAGTNQGLDEHCVFGEDVHSLSQALHNERCESVFFPPGLHTLEALVIQRPFQLVGSGPESVIEINGPQLVVASHGVALRNLRVQRGTGVVDAVITASRPVTVDGVTFTTSSALLIDTGEQGTSLVRNSVFRGRREGLQVRSGEVNVEGTEFLDFDERAVVCSYGTLVLQEVVFSRSGNNPAHGFQSLVTENCQTELRRASFEEFQSNYSDADEVFLHGWVQIVGGTVLFDAVRIENLSLTLENSSDSFVRGFATLQNTNAEIRDSRVQNVSITASGANVEMRGLFFVENSSLLVRDTEVSRVRLEGNGANTAYVAGGMVYANADATVKFSGVTVAEVTLSATTTSSSTAKTWARGAVFGGADIVSDNFEVLFQAENSTFSSNRVGTSSILAAPQWPCVRAEGGALYLPNIGPSEDCSGDLTLPVVPAEAASEAALFNVTLANNGATEGGGFFAPSFTTQFMAYNSIFSFNEADSGEHGKVAAGEFQGSHNVFTSDDGSFDARANTVRDPDLLALADNGGVGRTHAVPMGSVATTAGDPDGCRGIDGEILQHDQRGVARAEESCVVGAYSP